MNFPLTADSLPPFDQKAAEASRFLKSIAHEGRLTILWHLALGEKSVSQLEVLLDARQAAVSQMLARLRNDGLVQARREGKTVYYSFKDAAIAQMIEVLHGKFCASALSDTIDNSEIPVIPD